MFPWWWMETVGGLSMDCCEPEYVDVLKAEALASYNPAATLSYQTLYIIRRDGEGKIYRFVGSGVMAVAGKGFHLCFAPNWIWICALL